MADSVETAVWVRCWILFFLSNYEFDNAKKFQIDSLKVARGSGESWGVCGGVQEYCSPVGPYRSLMEAAFCPYATELNIFLLWKEFEIYLHLFPPPFLEKGH